MKIAHLILAHNAPEQLARLVNRLQHADAAFFIHIDAKADIKPFLHLADSGNVHFIQKREKVFWGAYSIVQATVNGFREILATKDFTHINLLSGADYPLRSTQEIHDFFSVNADNNYMHFLSVADEWQEAIPRLKEYHLTNYQFPGKYKVQRVLNKILPEREMPNGLVPFGRSQWFTITTAAAAYIIGYLDRHPGVVSFFKWTWAPDEIIFQTILYNSDFRKQMINANLRYVDWSEGKPSPKTLTIQDLTNVLSSGNLFARKFDTQASAEILDQLDKQIS